MLDYENRGMAVFEVDSVIWTNAQLSSIAARFFPKCAGKGSRQLDNTLKEIAHKLALLDERPQAAVRISRGFELAVFQELVDGGMRRCPGTTALSDPGGIMLCTEQFISAQTRAETG